VPGRPQLRWNTGFGVAYPQATAGPLATGLRAHRDGPVGFLGDPATLTVLNPGGSTPAGTAWDTNALIISGSNVTLDGYLINGTVFATGSNPTLRNCKVIAPAGQIFVATLSGSGKGVFTAEDCTLIGTTSGSSYQVNGLSSDSALAARRCDVSGSGDGIHINTETGGLISQCYVHDLAAVDASQHLDGIQSFNSAAGSITVEHNWVEMPRDTSLVGVSSCMTCGTEVLTDPIATLTINNNFLSHGGFTLRLNHRLTGCVVTNNDFGPLNPEDFGNTTVDDPSSVTTWSNNRDSSGNLIPPP
jgi:hypothetical protein